MTQERDFKENCTKFIKPVAIIQPLIQKFYLDLGGRASEFLDQISRIFLHKGTCCLGKGENNTYNLNPGDYRICDTSNTDFA